MQQIFAEWKVAAPCYVKLLRACHRLSHGDECKCAATQKGVRTNLFANAVRCVTSAIKNRAKPTKPQRALLESGETLNFDFFTMQSVKSAGVETTEVLDMTESESAEQLNLKDVVRVKFPGYATLSCRSSSHTENVCGVQRHEGL